MPDPTARAAAQALEVFVPGKLGNPMNGSHGHWSRRSAWAKDWRTRTKVLTMVARPWVYQSERPKCVRFIAHTYNPVDTDGLSAMLKPVRDGLVDAGVIDDDGPHSGHVFMYEQVVDRKRRGVAIEIRLLQSTVDSDCGEGRG